MAAEMLGMNVSQDVMDTDVSNHHNSPFLSKLSVGQKERLLDLGVHVTFEDGDVIFRSGQPLKHLHVLISGTASVDVRMACCTVRIQSLGSGDVFGWSALLDGVDTLFQVSATDHCSTLRFDAEGLLALCHDDPALGVDLLHNLLYVIAGRVLAVESRLAEFCGVSRRQRCCS